MYVFQILWNNVCGLICYLKHQLQSSWLWCGPSCLSQCEKSILAHPWIHCKWIGSRTLGHYTKLVESRLIYELVINVIECTYVGSQAQKLDFYFYFFILFYFFFSDKKNLILRVRLDTAKNWKPKTENWKTLQKNNF